MLDPNLKHFIVSTISAMQMMVGSKPEPIKGYVKGDEPTPGDISGVVGLAGAKCAGSVALKFPLALILKIYENMVGEKLDEPTGEVFDAVGELANIVAGSGKSSMAAAGIRFEITIPSVIIGENHSIGYGKDQKVYVIPFFMDGHIFYLETMLKYY